MQKTRRGILYAGMTLWVGMLLAVTSCQKLDDPAYPPFESIAAPATENTDSGPIRGTSGSSGLSEIFDPLTNGQTAGAVFGGEFTPEGYKVTTNWGGYLAYSTNILNDIRVEFDAKGYIAGELDGEHGKMIVIQIFDAGHEVSWMGGSSAWYANCLYELRKKGARYSDVDGVHLRFDSPGAGEEYRSADGQSPAGHPLAWNADATYHWVFTIKNHHTTITRNGQIIFDVPCDEFNPQYPLNIRIGGSWYGRSGPRDVTYSNVTISRL